MRRFRADIEGLRAVAVTIVVLSHLGLGFPGGFVGVDVFFVISGFLITRQIVNEYTRTGRISIRGFYARRAKRILPAATVVIVATIAACRVWDSPLLVRSDALDGLFSAVSGINWRLASQGTNYFAIGTSPSPFQHYWSLSVEEQFYLVWPALILLISSIFGQRYGRRTSLIWVLLGLITASLAWSILSTKGSPSWAYFGTATRVWELGVGALLAVTVQVWTRMPPALASQMSWLGLTFIMISCFVFDNGTVYPGSAAILPVLGSAFVIAGGCPGWPRSGELLLRRKPFQFVGNISYSWYLTHWPILIVLPMALNHSLSTTEKWYVLGGSFAAAVAMYYAVELPVRTRSILIRRPLIGLGFGGALVLASVIAALVVTNSATIPGQGKAAVVSLARATPDGIRVALAAATKAEALPRTNPSLAKAATDRPKTKNCLLGDAEAVSPPDSACTFGDPNGSKTIALVGDSHANQWEPPISAFGKTHGFRILEFAKAGCPIGVYPEDIDPATNRIYTTCNSWRASIFARIKAIKPNFVVMTGELRTLDIDPSGELQSIRQFQNAGSRVIYLEDTPNPEVLGPVPDCLAKNVQKISKCFLSRAAASTRLEGFIQRRTEAGAAHQAGALILDPTNWFCTATTCPPVINNMIVYADVSHVTATYASWLTPLMSAALAKLTR